MAAVLQPIKAILFDLDGTLYHQWPVRWLMALELVVLPVRVGSLRGGRRIWKVLSTFRRVREGMRARKPVPRFLDRTQYAETADLTGSTESEVEAIVREWILTRPLRYVRIARRRGLRQALDALRGQGLLLGVFSDYPAEEKLCALGVRPYFGLTVCATDPDVDAFKPDPRGFLRACEQWGLDAASVVYVGDRSDVDAPGAAAAGMRCIIIGLRVPRAGRHGRNYVTVGSSGRLKRALSEWS